MNTKTKLLAGALGVLVGLSASAGDRAWGMIDYQYKIDKTTKHQNYNLTNVTAAGHACLKPSDMAWYPLPDDWIVDSNSRVNITFNPNISDHEWGSSTITNDSIEINTLSNVPYFFKGADDLVALQAVGSNSMITTTRAVGDTKVSNFASLNFIGAGQKVDDFAPYDGGAIHMIGGQLALDSCTFTNFVTRFSGGAVCGERLYTGAYINKCKFYDNKSHPINGYGGALYLTRHRDATNKTVYAAINACTFVGNSAENGGAICGYTAIHDDEAPIRIAISSNGNAGPMILEDNHAVYEGGAVFTEGNLEIKGTGVVFNASLSGGVFFRSNSAGISGGAICQTGIEGESAPTSLLITNGCIFADNIVSNANDWTAGGAVSVMIPGSTVLCRQFVTFTNNQALGAADMQALGGAFYAADGVTNEFRRTMFVGNFAKAGDQWCYGGAVSAANGPMSVGTCVFDCGTNGSDKVYGSAIDFYNVEARIWNSTFRRGTTEAISAYDGSLAVTNCVIVGNGADGDLYLEGKIPVTMVYTAYGKMLIDTENGATFTGQNNLSNRVAAEVYNGETLRLRGDCFNPVAGLGIRQPGVTDYDWRNESGSITNTYGRLPLGYSMGAYETNTLPLTVELTGTKDYDGNTSSNGCGWTWATYTNAVDGALVKTDNADWNKLYAGAFDEAYAITNFVFSSPEIGWYYSTNDTLTGAVTCRTDRVTWLSTVVTNIFAGQIVTNELEDVIIIVIPPEYVWTGEGVTPGQEPTGGKVIVSNNVHHILIPPSDYYIEWSNNTNLTDSAVVTVTATNHYSFVETQTFFITGYETQFYVDDILDNVTTNGMLSASNAVAVITVPGGYCLDYQNSTTNKTVYRFGQGGSGAPDVTTLKVLYATDSNGDGVPDKYQKKLVVATLNGEWNGTSNAYDQVRLITMTNGVYTKADGTTEGMWSQSSAAVCTLTDELLPAVGLRPLENFKAGSWASGTGAELSEPLRWSSFPIYLYSYKHDDKPRTDPTKPRLTMAMAMAASSSEYEPVLVMTGFEIGEDGGLAGAVEAQVRCAGKVVANVELSNTKLEVLGAETLGGEWFKVADVTTDAEGVWTVTRVRSARAGSLTRTRGSNAEGDHQQIDAEVSGSGQPKFFKVQLVEE